MKKLISILLAVLLVSAVIPFSVSADEYEEGIGTVVTTEEEFRKAAVAQKSEYGDFYENIMIIAKDHIVFTSDLTVDVPKGSHVEIEFRKGFTVNEGVTVTVNGDEGGWWNTFTVLGDSTVDGTLTGHSCGYVEFRACDLRGSGKIEGDFEIRFTEMSRSIDMETHIGEVSWYLAVSEDRPIGQGVEVCEISSLLTFGNGVSQLTDLYLDSADAESFGFSGEKFYSDVTVLDTTGSVELDGELSCNSVTVMGGALMSEDEFPNRVVTFGGNTDIRTLNLEVNGSVILEKGAKISADYSGAFAAEFYDWETGTESCIPNYWRVKSGAQLTVNVQFYVGRAASLLIDGTVCGEGVISGEGDLLAPGTLAASVDGPEADRDVYTLDTPIGRYIMTNEGNGIHSYTFGEGEFPAGLDELLVGAANTGLQIGMPYGEPVRIDPPAGDVRIEFNADGDKISVNGTVLNGSAAGSGDVNGDGKVNAKDVSAILKVLAGWTGVECDTDAADYNADGKLNAKDVSALMKFLAGWN